MARTIFLVLVFVNLAVLAWIYLTSEERALAGREPERAKVQISADRIRLIDIAQAGSSAVAAGSLPQLSAASGASPVAVGSCVAYSGATVAEARQIASALTEKLATIRVVVNPLAQRAVFEIIIGGLVSRAQVDSRLAELKRLGFEQGIAVRNSDDKHFSLLLASFGEKAAAEEAKTELTRKGVKSAQVVGQKSPPDMATLDVHGGNEALKKLSELVPALKKLNQEACAVP